MHLLIFDPHDRGHYLTYVRHLVQTRPPASKITLIVRQGAESSVPYQQQLGPNVGGLAVVSEIGLESYREPRALLHDFTQALERHRPDHVWVPSGDTLVHATTLGSIGGRWRFPRGIEGECGLIELRFHRRARRLRGRVRQALERALYARAPWRSLQTIDSTVFAWSQARGGRLASKISLVPDPVDNYRPVEKAHARRALGMPEEGRYVVAAGMLAIPRKGTSLLLHAFARAHLAPGDRLLLAGELGDAVRHELQTTFSTLCHADRILTIDRYLDDQTIMLALSAADLVCAPYSSHLGTASIVLRSGRAKRPVLVPDQGWLGEIVPQFGLGSAEPILDVDRLAGAVRQSLDRSDTVPACAARDRLLEYSTGANFARAWARRLRERLQLPPDEAFRTWDWVQEAL